MEDLQCIEEYGRDGWTFFVYVHLNGGELLLLDL